MFLRYVFGQRSTLRPAPLRHARAHRAFFQRLEQLLGAHPLHRLTARRLRIGCWSFMADCTVRLVQGGAVLRMSRTRENQNAEQNKEGSHAVRH